jgi:hypothetical protein
MYTYNNYTQLIAKLGCRALLGVLDGAAGNISDGLAVMLPAAPSKTPKSALQPNFAINCI